MHSLKRRVLPICSKRFFFGISLRASKVVLGLYNSLWCYREFGREIDKFPFRYYIASCHKPCPGPKKKHNRDYYSIGCERTMISAQSCSINFYAISTLFATALRWAGVPWKWPDKILKPRRCQGGARVHQRSALLKTVLMIQAIWTLQCRVWTLKLNAWVLLPPLDKCLTAHTFLWNCYLWLNEDHRNPLGFIGITLFLQRECQGTRAHTYSAFF